MSDDIVKMIYIPAQHRVRVELTKRICLQSLNPPQDLIQRAKEKLEKEVDAGHLEFYRFFETRLNRMWAIVRDSDIDPDEKIGLTLATGAPHIPGVSVTPVQSETLMKKGVIAYLDVDVSDEVRSEWRFKTFKLKTGYMLRQLGIMQIASASQLYGLWYRASQGASIENEPLYSSYGQTEDTKNLKYSIEMTRRGDVVLRVFRIDLLEDHENFEDVIEDAKEFVANIVEKFGFSFKFLTTNVIRNLRSASRGPERFGLDLPLVILAALNQKTGLMIEHPDHAMPTFLKKTSKTSIQDVLCRSFVLQISADKSVAVISTSPDMMWERLRNLTNEQWLAYLRSQHIDPLTAQDSFTDVKQAILSQQNIKNMRFAHAIYPKSGADPFLKFSHPMVRDGAGKERLLVTKGQEIARLVYRCPPENGKNVCGEATLPEENGNDFQISLEGGVEEVDGVFYATVNGVADYVNQTLTVKESVVHEGHLTNLHGHFLCTTSAEIKGNVEKDVLVHVVGDLHIRGIIEGGMVICHGDLTVDGGVVGGSYLRSKGVMNVGFAENSTLITQQDLFVKEHLVACRVYADRNLTMKGNDSSILGGHIQWGTLLRSPSVGAETGAHTTLQGGSYPYLRMVQEQDKQRQQRIELFLQPFYSDLKELRRRNKQQMGKKLQQRKVELIAITKKGEKVLETLKNRILLREKDLKRTTDSSMKVKDNLSINCSLKLSGEVILIRRNFKSVHVVSGGDDETTTFLSRSGGL